MVFFVFFFETFFFCGKRGVFWVGDVCFGWGFIKCIMVFSGLSMVSLVLDDFCLKLHQKKKVAIGWFGGSKHAKTDRRKIVLG